MAKPARAPPILPVNVFAILIGSNFSCILTALASNVSETLRPMELPRPRPLTKLSITLPNRPRFRILDALLYAPARLLVSSNSSFSSVMYVASA